MGQALLLACHACGAGKTANRRGEGPNPRLGRGVIEGYGPDIDPAAIDFGVTADA